MSNYEKRKLLEVKVKELNEELQHDIYYIVKGQFEMFNNELTELEIFKKIEVVMNSRLNDLSDIIEYDLLIDIAKRNEELK